MIKTAPRAGTWLSLTVPDDGFLALVARLFVLPAVAQSFPSFWRRHMRTGPTEERMRTDIR